MKYEFRKQLLSKIIILVTLAILECSFLYGMFTENEDAIATSVAIFTAFAFIATLFVSFECVFTYSNDLKTKQSYMLFLTPNSTYKIVGAKILMAILQIALTGAVLVAVVILNVIFVAIRFDEVGTMFDFIRALVENVLGANLDLTYIIATLVYMLLNWISVVILAMLAITLSATFLANSKLKGFVSLGIFFLLNYFLNKCYELLLPEFIFEKDAFIVVDLAILAVVGLTYFATSWMLDKKVSV